MLVHPEHAITKVFKPRTRAIHCVRGVGIELGRLWSNVNDVLASGGSSISERLFVFGNDLVSSFCVEHVGLSLALWCVVKHVASVVQGFEGVSLFRYSCSTGALYERKVVHLDWTHQLGETVKYSLSIPPVWAP